jgi:hypothetical protein
VGIEDIRSFLSCQGGELFERSTDYTHTYFGKERKWTEIVFSTANRDKEITCCARCYFEHTPGGKTVFRHYLFTTNDPLAADNFNTYRLTAPHSGAATGKCVEQSSFCEDKVRVALSMTDDDIYDELLVVNTFVKADFLRTLISEFPGYSTDHIPKALPVPEDTEFRRQIDEIKKMILRLEEADDTRENQTELARAKAELETTEAKHAPFKAATERLASEEVFRVREVARGIAKKEFVQKYRNWADSKLYQTTTLHPFKAYKSVGRNLVMSKANVKVWDKLAFVDVLSRRWLALMQSPVEARLFCLSPDHFTEASKDDKLWAFKLDDRKLGNPWFETERGRNFIFKGLENIASKQYQWLEELKQYCEMETPDGDEMAYKHLIDDSPQLRQRLGLTQTLMKELWTGNIVFSDRLIRKLQEEFAKYKIYLCDFKPLDLVQDRLGDDYTILKSIGKDAGV